MKLSEVIDYNRGRGNSDGNNYWAKYRAPRAIYITLMLILMGIGIGLVSLFLGSAYLDQIGWGMFISYLNSPLILALNIAPCILLVFFFYFATGRAWAAFTFPGLIVFSMSLINYYKIRLRSEAFIASDFVFAGEAAGIITNYKIEITGRAMLTIGLFVFGILFAALLMRGKMRSKVFRIIGVILVIAVCAALYCTVYTDSKVYSAADNSKYINRWSDLQVFVSKGFMYSFIHSVPDAFPTIPEGYDEDASAKIIADAGDDGIDSEKKVDFIAVQLEAYADLSENPEVPVYDSVYAPLHELEEECVCGNVIANVFGGGTVDTERNFLTGYPHSESYRAATSSYVRYLKSQGYAVEGMHTGDDWFYNRANICEYLGFDDYYFLQDFGVTNRTDEFFFSKLTEMYENRDEDTPYFNFSITYQNHGAYSTTETVDEAYLERGDMSEESYNILNNYLCGIADTTRRMKDFIDSFRDSDEPVVIFFYGDHKPWLGDGNSVYNELGINIDLSTEDGFYNYFSAPYILWANDAAKEILGNDFTGDGGDMSSCFLMDMIFDRCSWGKSAYMKQTSGIRGETSVINTATGIYLVDGTVTKDLPDDLSDSISNLFRLEYYMKKNLLY